MNKITEYIIQINSLNYNNQYKYVKNKLLSIDFCDTTHVFLKGTSNIKKTTYLFKIDIEINQEGNHLFHFFHELDDRSYFKDNEKIRSFIKVNYIKLSDNIYQIDVIVKKSPIPIISYINVNKICKQIY